MPSIEEVIVKKGPRDEPLSYPGTALDYDYLWVDTWVYNLYARHDRRLGQWGITVDGGPLDKHGSLNLSAQHVNQALLLANSATIDNRYPVLAIGSNAAPAQLIDKFKSLSQVSRVVPVTLATVKGLSLCQSPHVSNPGYMPYIVADDGSERELRVSVLWLDSYQVESMSRTEPNYELVPLSGDQYPMTVGSNESISTYGVYAGKWGALRLLGGSGPAPAETQKEVFQRLSGEDWFKILVGSDEPEAIVELLRSKHSLRDDVRRELKSHGLVVPNGLVVNPGKVLPYGELMPKGGNGADELVVSPTPDATFPRRGEQYALLGRSSSPGAPTLTHVILSSCQDERLPQVLARVSYLDELKGKNNLICLDQTIRNGIGVELGELVRIRPAKVKRQFIADHLLSRSSYVLCRVQVAGLPTVEQQVCMVNPVVLEMLGTSGGDEVVIEGIPSATSSLVPTLRLKAYATPADVNNERLELAGGDLNSRYPSAQDALGVYPDLPWIFLDNATRSALGVDEKKLSVVRLRASRGYQLNKELREAVLLLAFAFVGVISVLQSTRAIVATTVLLIILALFLIHRRIRRRLSRRFVFEQRRRTRG